MIKLKTNRVGVVDKMFFAQYLALMLRSGISLTKGLEFLVMQMENRRMKEVVAGLARDITAGMSVSESFKKYPDVFDELFINMIASGEVAGNLDEVLEVLAEELRKAAELRSKVIGALIYPAIVVTMMIAVSIFIVFFVFPRIIKVYESLNVRVPLLTRILIAVIRFLVADIKYFAAGFAVAILGLIVAYRTASGKRMFHWLWLRLPIIKTLSKKISTVQFARTLSSLLKSGLAIPQALEITSHTFNNSYYRDAVASMAIGMRQGKRMSDLVAATGALFPPVVGQMTGVGEETGSLAVILKQLALFYEQEVDMMMNNLSKIIEPILMIAIGIVVGFIAIATVQLIYASLQGVAS